MLFHILQIGPLANNCYVLADEKTKNAAIFDAPFDGETIIKFLNKNEYILKYIILTHSHFDHIGALDHIKELTGADIIIHKNGKDKLTDPKKNQSLGLAFSFSAPPADKLVDDGYIVTLDSIEMKIIHTPGHTDDSMCILISQQNADDVLISGDTLFRREIGRCDLPTGNFKQEIESIKNKLLTLPENTKVYPGHDRETTIGEEKAENPYLCSLTP